MNPAMKIWTKTAANRYRDLNQQNSTSTNTSHRNPNWKSEENQNSTWKSKGFEIEIRKKQKKKTPIRSLPLFSLFFGAYALFFIPFSSPFCSYSLLNMCVRWGCWEIGLGGWNWRVGVSSEPLLVWSFEEGVAGVNVPGMDAWSCMVKGDGLKAVNQTEVVGLVKKKPWELAFLLWRRWRSTRGSFFSSAAEAPQFEVSKT